MENDGAPGSELLPALDGLFYLPYSDAQAIFLITPENKVTNLVFLQSAMGDWILRKIDSIIHKGFDILCFVSHLPIHLPVGTFLSLTCNLIPSSPAIC